MRAYRRILRGRGGGVDETLGPPGRHRLMLGDGWPGPGKTDDRRGSLRPPHGDLRGAEGGGSGHPGAASRGVAREPTELGGHARSPACRRRQSGFALGTGRSGAGCFAHYGACNRPQPPVDPSGRNRGDGGHVPSHRSHRTRRHGMRLHGRARRAGPSGGGQGARPGVGRGCRLRVAISSRGEDRERGSAPEHRRYLRLHRPGPHRAGWRSSWSCSTGAPWAS